MMAKRISNQTVGSRTISTQSLGSQLLVNEIDGAPITHIF
jgi:hypothetical protein